MLLTIDHDEQLGPVLKEFSEMLKVDREGIEFRYKEALVFDDSTPHRLRMGRSAVLNYAVK